MLLGNFFPVLSQPIPKDQSAVIGKVYKQINEIGVFKNYKVAAGNLIENSVNNRTGFTQISDGSNVIILLTKFIAPSSSKILAVLDIGKTESNTQVIIMGCRVDKKKDGHIVALAKSTTGPYIKNIIKAWKVDLNTNRFISISVKGIDCIDVGEDAD